MQNSISKDEMVGLRELVSDLDKLCAQAQSGTLYIYTADEYGAVVAIKSGKIVETIYRSTKGLAAVAELAQVQKLRYFFKPNEHLTSDNTTQLPENKDIFAALLSQVKTMDVVAGRAKKVLVVDDSPLARKMVVQVLTDQNMNIETVEAKDGVEALEKARAEQPDVVLLDLILPRLDGYGVLAQMKKDNDLRNIPVVVLTSRDALFDKLKGKMSGTDEYLTKPIQPGELRTVLQKYI